MICVNYTAESVDTVYHTRNLQYYWAPFPLVQANSALRLLLNRERTRPSELAVIRFHR